MSLPLPSNRSRYPITFRRPTSSHPSAPSTTSSTSSSVPHVPSTRTKRKRTSSARAHLPPGAASAFGTIALAIFLRPHRPGRLGLELVNDRWAPPPSPCPAHNSSSSSAHPRRKAHTHWAREKVPAQQGPVSAGTRGVRKPHVRPPQSSEERDFTPPAPKRRRVAAPTSPLRPAQPVRRASGSSLDVPLPSPRMSTRRTPTRASIPATLPKREVPSVLLSLPIPEGSTSAPPSPALPQPARRRSPNPLPRDDVGSDGGETSEGGSGRSTRPRRAGAGTTSARFKDFVELTGNA